MLPSISIGSFLLQTPGLALLLGVWLGTAFVEKEAERLSLNKDIYSTLILVSLIFGIIGSRVVYAARVPNVYLENPLGLFSLNTIALDPWGGLIIGVLAALIIGQRKKLILRPTLDAFALGGAAFMIAWAVSHILSGNAFGSVSQVPWAIFLWDDYRHPVQIYELILSVGIFIIIWQRPLKRPGAGLNLVLFIALTSMSRLLLEAFRGDSIIWFGSFRAAQIISLVILLASIWQLSKWIMDPQTEKN
jgi:phosphatidylglycerol:prolipoprotein diacylglycerol transferase